MKDISRKRLKYSIISILILFQLAIFIYFLIRVKKINIILHISNVSFIISTFYLLIILICDSTIFFFSSRKLDKINYFFRNSFSKVAFPFCFMITLGFWIIVLVGIIFKVDTFLDSKIEISVMRYISSIYLHLGITIIMLVELFLNSRDEIKPTLETGIANTIIFAAYITTICIYKYVFKENAYHFMKKMDVWPLIAIGFGIYLLLIGSFFLFMIISNKINKKYIENKRKEEKDNITEGEFDDNNFEYILGE